jgi:hypothetical protein
MHRNRMASQRDSNLPEGCVLLILVRSSLQQPSAHAPVVQ